MSPTMDQTFDPWADTSIAQHPTPQPVSPAIPVAPVVAAPTVASNPAPARVLRMSPTMDQTFDPWADTSIAQHPTPQPVSPAIPVAPVVAAPTVASNPGPALDPVPAPVPSTAQAPSRSAANPHRPAIERLLAGLVLNGGSDLHLVHDQAPRARVHGRLQPISGEDPIHGDVIETWLAEILSPEKFEEFQQLGDLDASYRMSVEEGAELDSRFRINVFRAQEHTGAVLRVIPSTIPNLDDLGVPSQVRSLLHRPRGLVLVCGPTGSGKSTTLAAMVDVMNQTRDDRIVTLEDPVEFVHNSKRCLVSHREIGVDTPTFAEGLRRVRRQDPDFILIGELRDPETTAAAIEAADTGHLVFGTLHTNSAPETISRIINQFPEGQQAQIRVTLSSTLLAVVCQTLIPAAPPASGRVLAAEVMMVNDAIANNIRENDIPAISNAMSDTSGGNLLLDAHLAQLVREQRITPSAAKSRASSPDALDRYLRSR